MLWEQKEKDFEREFEALSDAQSIRRELLKEQAWVAKLKSTV